jgi:hypothetical protein
MSSPIVFGAAPYFSGVTTSESITAKIPAWGGACTMTLIGRNPVYCDQFFGISPAFFVRFLIAEPNILG